MMKKFIDLRDIVVSLEFVVAEILQYLRVSLFHELTSSTKTDFEKVSSH